MVYDTNIFQKAKFSNTKLYLKAIEQNLLSKIDQNAEQLTMHHPKNWYSLSCVSITPRQQIPHQSTICNEKEELTFCLQLFTHDTVQVYH